MSQEVTGNIKSLSPSTRRNVARLYKRRLEANELVNLQFAREMCELAHDLGRRVGVLISREGEIEEVFLGTQQILYLPDLGRYRLGQGRLRRLRLIYTDLSSGQEAAKIPSDIYGDLEKLRFDAVVGIKPFRGNISMAWAHLLPYVDGEASNEPNVRTEYEVNLATFELDFTEFIAGLETELGSQEIRRVSPVPGGAALVGVYDKRETQHESSMLELKELARTAGVKVLDTIIQRRAPDPRTLLGKGKLEEVVLRCLRLGAEIVIFDCELSPGQWRIITNSTDLKVLDRSMLILDIFAQRATSSDGRLQVELAQLKYNLPRLVEMDAGLSRLSGGIGGRGPGETKLEVGRRRARDRIAELETRINKLGEERKLRRERREITEIPLVAILGYTNVGKSTLFNALTKSEVLVENKLFATLDTSSRRIVFPDSASVKNPAGEAALISDTVGFIRQLPEELMSAFRATLEELESASVFLHVLDASDPEIHQRKAAVESIVESIELSHIPVIVVLNKIDKVDPSTLDGLVREFDAIAVSALKKSGFRELLAAIRERLSVEQLLAVTLKHEDDEED